MKRISPLRAKYLNALGKKRWNKSMLRRREYVQNKSPAALVESNFFMIKAPRKIDIYEADGDLEVYIESMLFFKKVRKYLHEENAVLDFRNTKHIGAASVVILYATIESCRVSGKRRILLPPSDLQVILALRKSNIVKLVEKSTISYAGLSDKPQIPVVSGSGANYQEDIVDYIQKKIYSNDLDPDLEHKYGDAVSETINNVQMHAYTEGPGGPWWLLCSVINGRLFLTIYDCGIGIPKTVIERDWFTDLVSYVLPEIYVDSSYMPEDFKFDSGRLTDKQLIDLSMRGDYSGTKDLKHGQGSKSIKALIEDSNDGNLMIFSGKGLYKQSVVGGKIELLDLPEPVVGTLVQWSMSVT